MGQAELEKGAWYLLKQQKAWLQRRARRATDANGRRVTESEVLREHLAATIPEEELEER